MDQLQVLSRNVHRCSSCAGLWCKPETLEAMKREWLAEAVIDTGDPRVGANLNKVDHINCPEGHGPMRRTEDERQYHIWYEACDTCGGMFLDAGEFTDLKFDTLLDRIRGLIKGHRPDAES